MSHEASCRPSDIVRDPSALLMLLHRPLPNLPCISNRGQNHDFHKMVHVLGGSAEDDHAAQMFTKLEPTRTKLSSEECV